MLTAAFNVDVERSSPMVLFMASILTHQMMTRNSAGLLNSSTRFWHKTLPLSVQRFMRDSGIIRHMADCGSMVLGACLCLVNPSLAFQFKALNDRIKYYQYGTTHRHYLEVFSVENNNNVREPPASTVGTTQKNRCLVFVHGGAWGSGRVWQYRLIAKGLAKLIGANAVIMIGYPVYPYSTIVEQSKCITSALKYINNPTGHVHQELIKLHANGGIILAGHSSGANICALAMLDALSTEEQVTRAAVALSSSTECSDQTHTNNTLKGCTSTFMSTLNSPHTTTAKHNNKAASSVTAPNTNEPHGFENVLVFIGLAGVYDIVKHYDFEAARGVHIVSPMGAAARGPEFFWECSPTILAQQMITVCTADGKKVETEVRSRSTSEVEPCSIQQGAVIDAGITSKIKCLLLHGTDDCTVPHTSSDEFARELQLLGFDTYTEFIACDHGEPVLDLMFAHQKHTLASTTMCNLWKRSGL